MSCGFRNLICIRLALDKIVTTAAFIRSSGRVGDQSWTSSPSTHTITMLPGTEFIQPKRATQTETPPVPAAVLTPDLSTPQPGRTEQTIRSEPAVSPLISDHAKLSTPVPPAGSGVWKLKDIGLWPDVRAGGMYRRNVRILIQASSFHPCYNSIITAHPRPEPF